MRRRQDQMFTGVYQGTFRFGITSPQHKYQVLPLVAQSLYHGIGKSLPAVVAVRTRFISPHGKYRIHGKNTLFDPTVEITRCRYRLIQILMNLPEYILQRRRYRHTIGHRKTNAVILSGCGIGILPEYDDFYLLERASIENMKNLRTFRQHQCTGILLMDKSDQPLEIGLVELFLQPPAPTLFYFYFHLLYILKTAIARLPARFYRNHTASFIRRLSSTAQNQTSKSTKILYPEDKISP